MQPLQLLQLLQLLQQILWIQLATTLRLGGYPFVGNSEMAPFFWLAPGGANFLNATALLGPRD